MVALLLPAGLWAEPRFLLPKHHLEPAELAVIVNDQDPLSVQIADYYRQARGIPVENFIHVRLNPENTSIKPDRFAKLLRRVQAETPAGVQAYALTWASPFRVGCMSITSAFAFGYDKAHCAKARCSPTAPSPYYGSDVVAPHDGLGIRPTMAIAATGFAEAKALIDRGIAADGTHPPGTAYLVSTADKKRNVRQGLFATVRRWLGDWIGIEIVETVEGIRDRDDVLFYFTGATQVPYLETLTFRPGALADHLTSAGGRLVGRNRQMSSLRWLEAGATGSYGAVVEPCNYPQKFPNPGLAMQHYLMGETLIEAYWKSVLQPGEGIFIGEPLARPFGGHEVRESENETVLRTRVLKPGIYRMIYAPDAVGPYRVLPRTLKVPVGLSELRFRRLADGLYRLQRVARLPRPGTNGQGAGTDPKAKARGPGAPEAAEPAATGSRPGAASGSRP
jgi:uncharacterized protein (TIGR03790 family)